MEEVRAAGGAAAARGVRPAESRSRRREPSRGSISSPSAPSTCRIRGSRWDPPVDPRTWKTRDEHLETNLRGPSFPCESGRGRDEGAGRVILNLIDVSVERPYLAYIPHHQQGRPGGADHEPGARASPADSVSRDRSRHRPSAPRPSRTRSGRSWTKPPWGKIGTPEDVAAAALFLIEGSETPHHRQRSANLEVAGRRWRRGMFRIRRGA